MRALRTRQRRSEKKVHTLPFPRQRALKESGAARQSLTSRPALQNAGRRPANRREPDRRPGLGRAAQPGPPTPLAQATARWPRSSNASATGATTLRPLRGTELVPGRAGAQHKVLPPGPKSSAKPKPHGLNGPATSSPVPVKLTEHWLEGGRRLGTAAVCPELWHLTALPARSPNGQAPSTGPAPV